jgi:hypothetical protein
METIARFADVAAAEVARGFLASAGIDAFVADAHIARLDWRWICALGGVRLQVPEEQAADAVLLLEGHGVANLEEPAPEADAAERCPFCMSMSIRHDDPRKLKALSMLINPLVFLVVPILLATRGRLRCASCRKAWRPASRRMD